MTERAEDYRAKNARDGRAIYIPGKTVEQMKAEMSAKAAHGQLPRQRTVTLSEEEWAALDTALPDIMEVLHDTAVIFDHFGRDENPGSPASNAMLRIAARAVSGMQDRELRALDRLDFGIRNASIGRD